MDIVQQTIQTYDKIAPDYCLKTRQSKFLDWEETYIKKLLTFIPVKNPLILDAGCGDGRHCIQIERNGGRAIGIDLSTSMLKEAETLYPSGDFRNMDMRQTSFDNIIIDGIWSSGSIYHVAKSDVLTVIREFNRVLKPSGVVAINFKLGQGEGLEANPKSYSGSPRYFAYYTQDEMNNLFTSLGFDLIDSCLFPEDIYGDTIPQMWFRKK